MNEASTRCRALLMRCFLLVLAFAGVAAALRCHLFHDIYEAGKRMRILPAICSSEKYCVYATYKDPNWRKKNGYSRGCDRVDCVDAWSGLNTAWKPRGHNKTCRKHRDYGADGEICCCSTDYCNASSSLGVIAVFSSTILYYFFLRA